MQCILSAVWETAVTQQHASSHLVLAFLGIISDDGPSKGNSLLHAARKLPREQIFNPRQPNGSKTFSNKLLQQHEKQHVTRRHSVGGGTGCQA